MLIFTAFGITVHSQIYLQSQKGNRGCKSGLNFFYYYYYYFIYVYIYTTNLVKCFKWMFSCKISQHQMRGHDVAYW